MRLRTGGLHRSCGHRHLRLIGRDLRLIRWSLGLVRRGLWLICWRLRLVCWWSLGLYLGLICGRLHRWLHRLIRRRLHWLLCRWLHGLLWHVTRRVLRKIEVHIRDRRCVTHHHRVWHLRSWHVLRCNRHRCWNDRLFLLLLLFGRCEWVSTLRLCTGLQSFHDSSRLIHAVPFTLYPLFGVAIVEKLE